LAELRARARFRGVMVMSLIVIDDFLAEPELLRQRALGLKYENAGIDGLAEEVSFIVHERVCEPDPPQSHAKCRLTLASDNEPGRIHVDPSFWSGILYLSRPEHCHGGTEFYRHIPTGTDEVPRTIEEVNALGYASSSEMSHQILEGDGGDRSKWEHRMTVPMRFNRLDVLLQAGRVWSSSGTDALIESARTRSFMRSPSAARLTVRGGASGHC
jgi:hypothetical protein